MKINWKARFKSKTFVISFSLLTISFVYQMLNLFGVVPKIEEGSIVGIVTVIVNAAAMFGIVNDPTTPGLGDSERALTYYTENDERNDVG